MNTRRINQTVTVCVILLVLATTSFGNVIYCFNIFNNDTYASDSCLNFTVGVTDEGLHRGRTFVGFEFNNNSTMDSSITDIYFDDMPDGNLLARKESTLEGPGVSFSDGAKPRSLPGGSELTPRFDKKPEFSTDSDSPVSHNGINPGEWLRVIFKLESGKTYYDVLAALAAGGSTTESNLRIGIHIQAIGRCDDSASAINFTEPVPEPATLALLTLGTMLLRKRSK
ncbi:MAG: PEP-CTERM sorting domain-containing protein [Anaerohalosphaeraceae bacterium]|nr:PEP-CTERM sorting domain-containing protein [Anaerohalosphaeraceae bacterium]